jgi:hypothetical protein
MAKKPRSQPQPEPMVLIATGNLNAKLLRIGSYRKRDLITIVQGVVPPDHDLEEDWKKRLTQMCNSETRVEQIPIVILRYVPQSQVAETDEEVDYFGLGNQPGGSS